MGMLYFLMKQLFLKGSISLFFIKLPHSTWILVWWIFKILQCEIVPGVICGKKIKNISSFWERPEYCYESLPSSVAWPLLLPYSRQHYRCTREISNSVVVFDWCSTLCFMIVVKTPMWDAFASAAKILSNLPQLIADNSYNLHITMWATWISRVFDYKKADNCLNQVYIALKCFSEFSTPLWYP